MSAAFAFGVFLASLETSSKSKSKAADKIVRPHELEADHHGLRLEPDFPEFFDALLDLAF